MENQGQRTGKEILDSAWLPEEEAMLSFNGVSKDAVIAHWVISGGEDTLNAAIGSVVMLANGQGQERNEPFQTQAEADAQVSADAGVPVVEVSEVEGAPVVEVVAEEVKSEGVEEAL